MTLVTSIVEKVTTTVGNKVNTHPQVQSSKQFLHGQMTRFVPLHTQVRGLHLLQKLKNHVFNQEFPAFVEQPIVDVSTLELAEIDVSNPFLYKQKKWQSYFKRLRDEAPVHYQAQSPFGAFWSVTRYEDIVFVDKNHELFSAEPVIAIGNAPAGLNVEMFIAMDPPKHDLQRQAVQNVVAPQNLKELE